MTDEKPPAWVIRIAKLQTLETADDIYREMVSEGIKGHPRRTQHCPITNYVKKDGIPPNFLVATSVYELYVKDLNHKDMWVDKIVAQHPHTQAMITFVTRFDDNCYPNIIEHVDAHND